MAESKEPELFDALDHRGERIGHKMTRRRILDSGYARNVVHVWLVNSPEQLVIQQRAEKGSGLWDNRWDVSVGGGNTAGEEPQRSAARELKEELGLTEEAVYPSLRLVPGKFDGRWNTSKPMPDMNNRMAYEFSYTFLLRQSVELSELTVQPEEVAAIKTISLKNLARQVHHPEQYKKWVPHPREYYLGVIAAIHAMEKHESA